MNRPEPFDDVLDTVLGGWTAERPPEGFADRVLDANRRESPEPVPAKPSHSLRLPILAFVVVAATVVAVLGWVLRPKTAELSVAETPAQPVESSAEFRMGYCKLVADIDAANRHFPFDRRGADLSWSRFVELYGALGRVAEYEAVLRSSDRTLDATTDAMLTHTRELRITLFHDAWETTPQLPIELAMAPTGVEQLDVLSREYVPRCTLSIRSEDYQCGPINRAIWQAGRDTSVSLTFRSETGTSVETVTRTGPWALLRLLAAGRDVGEDASNYTQLRFDSRDADALPIDLVYRWMAGVDSRETRALLSTPVPVPQRMFEGDPPCGPEADLAPRPRARD